MKLTKVFVDKAPIPTDKDHIMQWQQPIRNALSKGKSLEVKDNGFRLEPLRDELKAWYAVMPPNIQAVFKRMSWRPQQQVFADTNTPIEQIETARADWWHDRRHVQLP